MTLYAGGSAEMTTWPYTRSSEPGIDPTEQR